jgi:hypothetical protein
MSYLHTVVEPLARALLGERPAILHNAMGGRTESIAGGKISIASIPTTLALRD